MKTKEQDRTKSAAYYLKNAEIVKTKKRAKYHENPEKKRIYQRIKYHENPEKYKVRSKIYHQKYPEKMIARNRKHKTLKLGNGHEPYTDIYIFERDNWICGICERKINKRLKWPNPLSKSIDHIVAITKGGADAPINLQAAHLRCNMIKQSQSGGQLRLIG